MTWRASRFIAKSCLQDRGEHDQCDSLFNTACIGRFKDTQRQGATQRIAALGEMTGGIAHDFRNILTVIKSGLPAGGTQFTMSRQASRLH